MQFTVEQDPCELVRPECRSRNLVRKGYKKRQFRGLPIGKKSVWIKLAIQRVHCLACGVLRQVKVAFADPRRSYTKAFERYVIELSRHMTIKDLALHLDVSWDVVKDIQKRNLGRHYSRPKLKGLEQIAIDEISIGKGHRYLTIVLDLKSGKVVFVGDGKGTDALNPFFKRLKRAKAKIKAVAGDMSPAYISAVLENLPKAKIIFDHFHVVKLFNERLSNLRRKLFREAVTTMEKEVIKGARWLLLKNPENLNKARNEAQRLREALEMNQPLAVAYYMKEEFRLLWSQPDKESASAFLTDWIKRAKLSGISMLKKFAKTLAAHRFGIPAYYDYPISTGPLEGANNKIKTMKRQAYGYRDMEFFKLKIMAAHKARYALVG